MATNPVLKVDGKHIRPGTSLFNEATGEVFWYRGIEEEFVHLEGVDHHTKIDTGLFHRQISTDEFVIESRPVPDSTIV